MWSIVVLAALCQADPSDLSRWILEPKTWTGAALNGAQATLTADKWSYLVAPDELPDVEISAKVTIEQPTPNANFFGEFWSAWPDPSFSDGGFDAGLLLRGTTITTTFRGQDLKHEAGYRVQLSHKYQALALVKFPDGGYVRVVPCDVRLNEPHTIQARVSGNHIRVSLDGQEKLSWVDTVQPLAGGRIGLGVNGRSKIVVGDVSVKSLPKTEPVAAQAAKTSFSARKFLGGRTWIFDGDEPILQLHYEGDPTCYAKLRPGYKPQLNFDSHWGLENQGAFAEASSHWTAPVVNGGGESIEVRWSAKNVKDRFKTDSTLTVTFDSVRQMYVYEIDSQLEVLPGEPFHFRYGFDFEHHTPLDPFRWQYLIARRKGGELYHRPVTPIDPGPQEDLEGYHGLRVWHGRHVDTQLVSPAVEYLIEPTWNEVSVQGKPVSRKLNTAVCAAFYDTGISFLPETAPPGTKVHVRYRYTGYPASETKDLFAQSKIYKSLTLDPAHYYLFADEWPKLTFREFSPLSESWIYGRTPFMTGHNQRPTYELVQNCGAGSGSAMQLPASSFGKAQLPVGKELTKGRWLVTALVKSVNVRGPGGRMELEATQAKTNAVVAKAVHYFGNGTSPWRQQGFVFDLADDAAALAVGFGNAGTGAMQVTEVDFRKLNDDESVPEGVALRPNDQPAQYADAPAGAVVDYRMEDGDRNFVLNHTAGGPHLDLANLEFVNDDNRLALKFADNISGQANYRHDSTLARYYLDHSSYAGRNTLPVATSGHHGYGQPIPGLTLAAWVKPAAEMGRSEHSGKGDIVGYGARQFILGLQNQKTPYQLTARINAQDIIPTDTRIEADRWYHVALTAKPADGLWDVTLYLDGKPVGRGRSTKLASTAEIKSSFILGAELFYMHDAYYRGLIGRTLVFHRALSETEIAELAK